MGIEIVSYSRHLDRAGFDCGKPELNDWLHTQASQQEKTGNTRTFLAVDGTQVVGYYASTTYRLELDEAAVAFGAGKRRYPVPAVLLARLAVDLRWQDQGLGGRLLVDALSEFAKAGRSIGFEVVVVHAIDSEAVTFYARYGFRRFEEHPFHLFLPTKDLLATIGG